MRWRWWRWRIASGALAGSAARASSSAAAAAAATPAAATAAADVPAPGGYNTPEYQASSYAVAANAIGAYDLGATGKGIKIGVVDSGINPTLIEFSGRIDPASGDVAGTRGVSDEGGHGTAVSAVAAAGRNGQNTLGVAFDATIVNLRADQPGTCASEGWLQILRRRDRQRNRCRAPGRGHGHQPVAWRLGPGACPARGDAAGGQRRDHPGHFRRQ